MHITNHVRIIIRDYCKNMGITHLEASVIKILEDFPDPDCPAVDVPLSPPLSAGCYLSLRKDIDSDFWTIL